MLITILVLSAIVLWAAFRYRTQVREQGVVLDFWNKYNTVVLSLGSISLVTIFGYLEPDQWTALFGEIGEFVKLIDAVIVAALMLYTSVSSLFNKAG